MSAVPRWSTESATLGLDRMELSASIADAAASGAVDNALACLLGLVALRVAEVCSINIEDLSAQHGHRIVTVVGKGSKPAVIALPPPLPTSADLLTAGAGTTDVKAQSLGCRPPLRSQLLRIKRPGPIVGGRDQFADSLPVRCNDAVT